MSCFGSWTLNVESWKFCLLPRPFLLCPPCPPRFKLPAPRVILHPMPIRIPTLFLTTLLASTLLAQPAPKPPPKLPEDLLPRDVLEKLYTAELPDYQPALYDKLRAA